MATSHDNLIFDFLRSIESNEKMTHIKARKSEIYEIQIKILSRFKKMFQIINKFVFLSSGLRFLAVVELDVLFGELWIR